MKIIASAMMIVILAACAARLWHQSGSPPGKRSETPDNRRRPITQSSVESLAKSLAREGVLQPIVVRPAEISGRYLILMGARRYRAATMEERRIRRP